ncbi:MAG: ATPase, T2SS/T4P/T4SS family [Chloroflexota bacterium]
MTNQNHTSHDDEDNQQPKLMKSFVGRTISVFGLVERIVKEFELEHGEGQSDAIKSATTDVERRQMLLDVAEYIFGVESLRLNPQEQAQVIGLAYGELFGYGPLDIFFEDERVTTISLEGASKINVRYGAGKDFTTHEPIFEDTPHMRRIIQRILRHAGAELRDDVPIIETGLTINTRRVSISVVAPPFAPEMAVDIRVHPTELPTANDWIEADILNEKTYVLLQAIMQSNHGLVIVGDTKSGKTTLTSILLQEIDGQDLISVERASELVLPEGATRLATQWATNNNESKTFGEQIQVAIESNPKTLVIDEIRNDEPEAIAPLLTADNAPRQIWSFRGASEAKRIASSFGILARMADSSQPEYMVSQLQKRLPFVVIIKRRKGTLEVRGIAEWQFSDDADYANFVSLMRVEWEGCEPTGKLPQHELDLPDNFWET